MPCLCPNKKCRQKRLLWESWFYVILGWLCYVAAFTIDAGWTPFLIFLCLGIAGNVMGTIIGFTWLVRKWRDL